MSNDDFLNNKDVRAAMYRAMREDTDSSSYITDEDVTAALNAQFAFIQEGKEAKWERLPEIQGEPEWAYQPAQTVGAADEPRRKWYNWYKFPLIPQWQYTPRDNWNEANINFRWLCFKLFSLGMPALGLSLEVHENGADFIITLLYLRLMIVLPLPDFVERFFYRHLSRSPRKW